MPDPGALAAIHAAAFTTPRPWTADEIAALLSGPGVFAVSEPEGFALGRAILDEAELLTIAVLPQARRRGLGRRILAGFEAGASARGATRGFLEVAAGNTAACALYTAAGWREEGRRRAYYGPGNDALLMARAFARPRA